MAMKKGLAEVWMPCLKATGKKPYRRMKAMTR